MFALRHCWASLPAALIALENAGKMQTQDVQRCRRFNMNSKVYVCDQQYIIRIDDQYMQAADGTRN